MSKIIGGLERVTESTGRIIAWFVVLLVALTFYDVLMRYLFNQGSVALQELEWHLFGAILLLGAAYTFKHREHVRVDIIYASNLLSDRQRMIIDLVGNILFLLPFCGLIIFSSIPFVETAFLHAEGSPDPGGLPYRWILKAAIPTGFALLAMQGIIDSLKLFHQLRQQKR